MRILVSLFTATLIFVFQPAQASDEDDMAEMQKRLNAETMAKPFFVEDQKKIEAFIKKSMENNIKPLEYEGTHWRNGYTCRDLRRHSWREYRNCNYYYRYYGYYYRH